MKMMMAYKPLSVLALALEVESLAVESMAFYYQPRRHDLYITTGLYIDQKLKPSTSSLSVYGIKCLYLF